MISTDPNKKTLTHADIELARRTRGRSMLLFITDRCPVGCQHCSVDSRPDSPTISDFELFGQIVDWLCGKSEIEIVGISGGEPFVERAGLMLASRRVADAGKQQVIYTSGIWATAETPGWIEEVLARCACVYLSTDGFHSPSVGDDRFVRAVNAIAESGAWIVVQVLDHEGAIEKTERQLRSVFGESLAKYAEMNPIVPLTNGRGADVFTRTAHVPGHSFGPCSLVVSPMVRYDGLVTGCCNESVIMGRGPSRLRKQAHSLSEVETAVEEFHADSLLRVIGDVGLGVLTEHPRFVDLADEKFASNCDLCWRMLDRMPQQDKPDHLIDLIMALNG
jgi:organic radical activating enzyme